MATFGFVLIDPNALTADQLCQLIRSAKRAMPGRSHVERRVPLPLHGRTTIPRRDYLLLFTGVAFCSVASKSLALSGTGTALWKTIALALTSFP
jgi:hypothetical protein